MKTTLKTAAQLIALLTTSTSAISQDTDVWVYNSNKNGGYLSNYHEGISNNDEVMHAYAVFNSDYSFSLYLTNGSNLCKQVEGITNYLLTIDDEEVLTTLNCNKGDVVFKIQEDLKSLNLMLAFHEGYSFTIGGYKFSSKGFEAAYSRYDAAQETAINATSLD